MTLKTLASGNLERIAQLDPGIVFDEFGGDSIEYLACEHRIADEMFETERFKREYEDYLGIPELPNITKPHLPGRGEDPRNTSGMLKRWLSEFYQGNGIKGYSEIWRLPKETLIEHFDYLAKTYDFTVRDI